MTKGVSFRRPVLASEVRRVGSSERLIGANNEYNASNKRDLMGAISQVLAMVNSGQEILTEQEAMERVESAKVHRELVQAAFNSKAAHEELGATIASELYQAANREGFCRRFLGRQELTQGNIPRVKMRMKNVTAVVAGGPTQVFAQIVRDNTIYPTEFNIMARPFIEEREIQQSLDDVLEEKFIEGQEGIMVAEDRVWYRMATATVNQANEFSNITGQLSPASMMEVRDLVTRWNIPAAHWLIASDIWNDITGNMQFAQIIDPVSKHELLMTGQLGTISGMSVISDAYRHQEHRVLNRGEFFIIGDAINHGIYTDRGGVTSTPIDSAIEKTAGRGWMFTELFSATIANARSVAKGRRQ